MTPYEINILLHYYARADDHPDLTRQPPIWPETIGMFLDQRLIEPSSGGGTTVYVLTERGRVYVMALTDVSLPVQVWVMPQSSGCGCEMAAQRVLR